MNVAPNTNRMIEEEHDTDQGEETGEPRDPAGGTAGEDAAREGTVPDANAEIAELELALQQSRDQLLRKAAEFDNYKKRMEAETGAVIRFANEDLLLRLLPVLDDFERSFRALRPGDTAPGEDAGAARGDSPQKPDAFITGVEMISGKFRKILEQAGLKPFESVGQPFDPELHDALLQVPRDDVPHHTVVEEIEKGYRLHEKVLRHARVIVSSSTEKSSS